MDVLLTGHIWAILILELINEHMDMKKYILYSLLGLLPFFSSCSDDVDKNGEESGKVPIQLSADMTRVGNEPARSNIYVKGFYVSQPTAVYFDETLASIPTGLTGSTRPIEFPGASPYYPFADEEIYIIAYSGKTQGGKMHLTAGTAITNDAILSNYGKRKNDADNIADNRTEYEPYGTPGNSSNPAEILQFRHVMTQLIVDTVIDQTSHVDRLPERIHFTLKSDKVVKNGYYPVRERENDPDGRQAVDLSNDSYTIQLGTNYLVPSGVDLFGVAMQTLTIDDYTASGDELKNYTIGSDDASLTSMPLRPGFSYRLTLTISRLGLTGIHLTKSDWVPTQTDGNLGVTPYTLNLDLGNYDTSQSNDTISRVVLMANNKQYVGKSVTGKIQFVTLPTVSSSVQSVILYTEKGRLINMPLGGNNTYTYNESGSNLSLKLSAGGMLTADGNAATPTNPYLITTAVQFMNVNKELNAHYKQMTTVDLNALNLIDESRLFNGFGDFSGTFDGNGYRIDGIDIVASGLFKSNSNTLKNIRLSTGLVDATGFAYAGAIAGTNSGSIIASVNEARIINTGGTTTIYGGIVGLNQNTGTVIASVNTGVIKQGDVVGGIIGENQNTNENVVVACINTGALNPEATYLGYLCGRSSGFADTFTTSFGLVGSAQHVIGGPELAVGTGDDATVNVAALEPAILRNGLPEDDTDDNHRIINRLNTALNDNFPAIAAVYKFVYDDPNSSAETVTGITWPAPVMK